MEIFEESYIRNLLKCNQCSNNFTEYDQPKQLQCGKIVCNTCEFKIEKNASNKKFKCEICLKYHIIPDEGLSINELAFNLIHSRPKQMSRDERYETLKKNLNKLDLSSGELKFNLENGNDTVKKYCNEQKRRVQLAFEPKMKELNDLNEAFIKDIDDFEENCNVQSQKVDIKIKKKIEKLINEVNNFSDEKKIT